MTAFPLGQFLAKSMYRVNSKRKEFASKEANSLLYELTPIKKNIVMKMVEWLILIVYPLPTHLMDGWMICDFMSFSTVFQSYQDDGWVIMKGCVQ